MDCATLCLISAAVSFVPTSDVQKCNYCLDVRGITPTCNEDIMGCAQTYPDMVLYCLTVNAIHFDTHVSRAVRCRSHKAYNVSLSWTEEIMGLEKCSFGTSKICNCSTCPLREETRIPQIFQHPTNFQTKPQNSLSNNGNKNHALPNRLQISAVNQNQTFLLTKGMAENIRGIGNIYNKATLKFSFFQFYFFVFAAIIIIFQ
uniref:Uncharacterized protein n=1 Tax=Panagrolaimus superbus TaxID=310955 RepID=A0A914Y8W1_9BILA